jgi:hypothetical protein
LPKWAPAARTRAPSPSPSWPPTTATASRGTPSRTRRTGPCRPGVPVRAPGHPSGGQGPLRGHRAREGRRTGRARQGVRPVQTDGYAEYAAKDLLHRADELLTIADRAAPRPGGGGGRNADHAGVATPLTTAPVARHTARTTARNSSRSSAAAHPPDHDQWPVHRTAAAQQAADFLNTEVRWEAP